MAKAKRRSAPASSKPSRFPETLILRMPKGTKARVLEMIAERGDRLVTPTDYLRKVLVDHLDLDLTSED